LDKGHASAITGFPLANVHKGEKVTSVVVRVGQWLKTDYGVFFAPHGKKYDVQFKVVFEAIRQLMAPPMKPKRKIGFHLKEKQARYGKKSPSGK